MVRLEKLVECRERGLHAGGVDLVSQRQERPRILKILRPSGDQLVDEKTGDARKLNVRRPNFWGTARWSAWSSKPSRARLTSKSTSVAVWRSGRTKLSRANPMGRFSRSKARRGEALREFSYLFGGAATAQSMSVVRLA
jgi:hypothetical protein